MQNDILRGLNGVKIGHWTDKEAGTGCTVILCPEGATAGVDVRGTAPATRETDLLDPVCMVQQVHAILIGGGSAYGLAASDGVMQWLEADGSGLDVGMAKVPIVPTACLFDLAFHRSDKRPNAQAGYAACEDASSGPVSQGNVGAGTGATVGNILGAEQAMKGGFGCATTRTSSGLIVSAVVAVNAFGSVIEPATGHILAGPRLLDGSLGDTVTLMSGMLEQHFAGPRRENTTLGVILTNATLDKPAATKTAQMAQAGLARTIRPAHSHFDGDAVFALSCGEQIADLTLIGSLAADVLAEAILNGIIAAETLHDIPSVNEEKSL